MGVLFGARPGEQSQDKRAAIWGITGAGDLIPPRPFQSWRGTTVTYDTALRSSAVWACRRLRADLISTMPLDVYRNVGGVQIEAAKPPVLLNPGGDVLGQGGTGMLEWMYSSQFDLDGTGNAIGLITQRDGFNLPSRIELAQAIECQVLMRKGQLSYRIAGTIYDPSQVWHEKQFTVPGLHVGLSPIAYAAWSIGQYLSIQDFATDWFAQGAVPKARLKNNAKTLDQIEAAVVKESWKASIATNEPFVHGNDWEYDMLQAQEASADWLEGMKFGITDVCRFFGVPADAIDATPTGSTHEMTYSNMTQKNLQLLIMNIGPSVVRRETALSSLIVQPRFVKLNTDALLRMDPQTRAATIKARIDSRTLTPDEARELENMPPLTDAQIRRFYDVFGVPMGGPSGDMEDSIPAPPKPAAPALPPASEPGELPPGDEPKAIEGPK